MTVILNLTVKHKNNANDPDILLLPGNKITLEKNEPMLKDVHQHLPAFLRN